MTSRTELREHLEHIAARNVPALRLTSLGMHFVDVGGEPVLVHVELNVHRLLAVALRRLRRSKRGIVTIGSGAMRVAVATPEGLEICARAEEAKR